MKNKKTWLLPMLLIAGCQAPRIETPPGFARVSHPFPHDFKAVSARGHVLALRQHPNPDAKADLAYWSQAVEHQKVTLDGLTLTGREEIRTKSGLAGTLFQFELGDGARKTGYWVGVFVDPRRIVTVEVGGPADELHDQADALHTAIRSVR